MNKRNISEFSEDKGEHFGIVDSSKQVTLYFKSRNIFVIDLQIYAINVFL